MRYAPWGSGGGLLSGQPQNPNRNWGANPERNQWVAGITGYDGDFSNGQFGQWGQQNGFDANTLVNAYDRMQNMGGKVAFGNQQPQMPQGGGWGSMAGLQGLLSGYAPAIHNGGAFGGNARGGGMDYGGGYAATAQQQAPFAGVMPTLANRGHNMLWSV